jgi:FkbM family methyltransferase
MRRLRAPFDWLGINRSLLVRWLTRYGSPRLRELRAQALADRSLRARRDAAFLRWLERGALTVLCGRAGGLRFQLSHLPVSHSQIGAIAFGDLESSVQEALVRHLEADGVLYDVGANIGFFTLLGAKLAPQGHVYAFEAAPDNALAIEANARLNGFANISVIAMAIGAHEGRGRLQIVDDQSWSKLEDYGHHPNVEQVLDVEIGSLDELAGAKGMRPPTLVKIDVEGAELAVIEGMAETIAAHRPAIVAELHGSEEEFVSRMQALGYRVENLEGPAPLNAGAHESRALALPGPAGPI